MVFLALLIALAATVLLALFVIWYATRLAGRFVGGHQEGAEEILATGCAPVAWLVDFRRNPPRVRRGMNKRKVIARLRGTLRYYRSTPLVPDEDTRRRTLANLKATLARWKTSPWSDILPPNLPL